MLLLLLAVYRVAIRLEDSWYLVTCEVTTKAFRQTARDRRYVTGCAAMARVKLAMNFVPPANIKVRPLDYTTPVLTPAQTSHGFSGQTDCVESFATALGLRQSASVP